MKPEGLWLSCLVEEYTVAKDLKGPGTGLGPYSLLSVLILGASHLTACPSSPPPPPSSLFFIQAIKENPFPYST